MPLDTKVGLGPGHIVLDGDPALPQKAVPPPPLFGLCLLWPKGWMDQDATWYRCRPGHRPHCVRWGPGSPCQKGAQQHHHFSAHVYFGQTAQWNKMPLGTEVVLCYWTVLCLCVLSVCHIFLSVTLLYCGKTAGWIRMPLDTKVDLGPGHILLHGDPALPTERGTAAPNFRPMSIVAKRWPISASAKLSFNKAIITKRPTPVSYNNKSTTYCRIASFIAYGTQNWHRPIQNSELA